MHIKRVRNSGASTILQFITEDATPSIADFTAEQDQITVRYEKNKTILYCGIGPKENCTVSLLRNTSANAARIVQKLKRRKIACTMPNLPLDKSKVERAIVEGILLGLYRFEKYKSEKNIKLQQIDLLNATMTPLTIQKYKIICDAVNYTRDLVNENASVCTPPHLMREARKLAGSGLCSVTVLDEKALKQKKLNLISAVGGGSTTPPVLIIIEYSGSSRIKEKTALIGKGVTFDSGGQNLKSTGKIETMREDMAGAAAVLGVFSACVKLKPSINLIGVIPAVHNAIGSASFFPGDIYTSYSGKSVEIWSTDAEGRLILADAIAYCRKTFKPAAIIDCATLTGGILSALGNVLAGLFSNNDEMAQNLFNAGEATGERLWRFPLYKEYSDSLKGDLGDIRNLSKFKKGHASSIIGAAFIKEFVDTTPWAHIDIAGTAFNEGNARGVVPQFGTGFGVRLLLDYLGP